MIGEKYITKLLTKAVGSSLRQGYTSMWNNMPITPFDKLSKAIFEGYCKSDVLYSIANKKATTGARAGWGVYKIKSKSKMQDFKSYLQKKDVRLDRVLELKESAIEPISHQLNERFDDPNSEMSGSEFTEALLVFLNMTGNCYQKDLRQGKRVIEMDLLPADIVEIITDGQPLPRAAGYRMLLGVLQQFDVEDVIHAKYNNPRWTPEGKHLYGMSPVQVLWNLLLADEEGNDALAEIRKNRGPRLVMGVETPAVKEESTALDLMNGLKNEFNERSRDYKDRMMPIWGKIQVENVGLSASDLDMSASSMNFFQKACNVFNVPWQWFSTTNESKYSNLEIYNKQAILNGVLPDLNKIRDARNRKYRKLGIISNSEVIDYDISVFSELNVDRGTMWAYLKDMSLKENDKLKEMGFDGYDDPNMEQILVSRNKIPIANINDINNAKTQEPDSEANQGTSGEGES